MGLKVEIVCVCVCVGGGGFYFIFDRFSVFVFCHHAPVDFQKGHGAFLCGKICIQLRFGMKY